jgi:prepilin signal peptidase PulO-like enzyme (type II secretory pathway)
VTLAPLISFLLVVAASLPLARADHRELTVPVAGLVVFWLVSAAASFVIDPSAWLWHGAGVTSVIAVGTLVSLMLPGRLGEADILYASGLAWVSSFSGFLVATALGCLGTLAAMVIGALRKGGWQDEPQPFLPPLLWGWITVTLVNLLDPGTIPYP